MKHLEVRQKYSASRRTASHAWYISSSIFQFYIPHFYSLKTVKKSSKNANFLIMEPLFDWMQSWSDLEVNILK